MYVDGSIASLFFPVLLPLLPSPSPSLFFPCLPFPIFLRHIPVYLPLSCPPSLQCQQGMTRAVATEEALGIEYDEETACDVCRDVSMSGV